jgi:hypothetical protein
MLAASGVGDDWRNTFRLAFAQLRNEVDLHPAGSTPAETFEAAARTARSIAAECLPLGIGLVMHLYPLCALRCVPLPWWSPAGLRRARVLRAIDRDGLVLANAGSERASGAHAPVTLTRQRHGVRVTGTFEYVSLANVADLVLFSTPLAGSNHSMFCIAELRSDAVRVGASRFSGSMKLSDTCPVTFNDLPVPRGRYLLVPTEAALSCMAQYQRSWFQLLLSEAYLARIERLHAQWDLPRSMERIASLNELSFLRKFSLCLLNEAVSPAAIATLARVTAAIKLRVSWHAQATASAVRAHDETSANELGYLKRQPTSDDRIVQALTAGATARAA